MTIFTDLAAQVVRLFGLQQAETAPVFATSRRTECLIPQRANDDTTPHGFLVGESITTSKPYSFSLHELYRQDIIQDLDMAVFGDVGTAKTSLVKCLAMNMLDTGGRVAIFDRKIQTGRGVRGGEYLALADDLGGTRVVFDRNPDLGCRINLLDPAFGALTSELASSVGPDRLLLLAAQVACGRSLEDTDKTFPRWALDVAHAAAITRAKAAGRIPELSDVIEALLDPDESALPGPVDPQTGRHRLDERGWVSLKDVFDWGLPVAMGLERYLSGSLSGLIDGQTRDAKNRPLDLSNNLIVFDTSALPEDSDEFGLMTLLAASWLQAKWVLTPGDKMLVWEEAYSTDQLAEIGKLRRSFAKRGRGTNTAVVDVFHHPAEALEGDQSSAVAKEASVIWVARQEHPADLDACIRLLGLPERAAGMLSVQPVGTWIVKVSGQPIEQVRHLRTQRQIFLTDSDMAVRGDMDGVVTASWI